MNGQRPKSVDTTSEKVCHLGRGQRVPCGSGGGGNDDDDDNNNDPIMNRRGISRGKNVGCRRSDRLKTQTRPNYELNDQHDDAIGNVERNGGRGNRGGCQNGEKNIEIDQKDDHLIGRLLRWHIANLEYACCLLYTSPSPRDQRGSRMPSSA